MTEKILPNTLEHEGSISATAKTIVAGCLDLCAVSLQQAVPHVHGDDPLSAERYIHLAESVAQIATSLYALGETARGNTMVSLRANDERRAL